MMSIMKYSEFHYVTVLDMYDRLVYLDLYCSHAKIQDFSDFCGDIQLD